MEGINGLKDYFFIDNLQKHGLRHAIKTPRFRQLYHEP